MIGMKINAEKTRMLCVNVSTSSSINTYINIDGKKIYGSDEMTMLGFKFRSRPNVDAHVKFIKKRFYSKVWILRHFKRAGTDPDDILKVYLSYVRPCIEYASCVYGPLLTDEQSEDIEKLQERSMKICFGFGKTYQYLLEKTDTTRLSYRRNDAIANFAKKSYNNPRFKNSWFAKNQSEKNLRHIAPLRVPFVKYDRYKKGHLNTMRQLLNELPVSPL